MTDTRTSEALSDDTYAVESVSWLRKTAAHHDAGVGMHTKYGAKLTAIADSLEAKDRAYADLSHLCANYKAESERLTTENKLFRDWSMVGKLPYLFADMEASIASLQQRIRQLEALRGEMADWLRDSFPSQLAKIQRATGIAERAKALAVPQEGNK